MVPPAYAPSWLFWSFLMPLIHIDQVHGLSLQDARTLAHGWVQSAQRDWAMVVQSAPDPQRADGAMVWQFSRSGVKGTLRVIPDRFVLDLRLGFLLGTFKDRIEAQLLHKLRESLAR